MAVYSVHWNLWSYQFWFNQYLCPLIKNSTFQDVRFLLLDDKTAYLPFWQMVKNSNLYKVSTLFLHFLFFSYQVLFDPLTYACADGFATQWYSDPPEMAIKLIQDTFCWLFPEKELQSTEASICQFEEDYNVTSDYDKANRYAKNIITVNKYRS